MISLDIRANSESECLIFQLAPLRSLFVDCHGNDLVLHLTTTPSQLRGLQHMLHRPHLRPLLLLIIQHSSVFARSHVLQPATFAVDIKPLLALLVCHGEKLLLSVANLGATPIVAERHE